MEYNYTSSECIVQSFGIMWLYILSQFCPLHSALYTQSDQYFIIRQEVDMHDMYEDNTILHPKRKLHAIMFSAFLVVVSAIFMFGLGNFGTQASRQRGNFLNAEFRSSVPNTWNIIYSLRGDGTPGSTAYTRTWTWSCMATNVVVLSPFFVGGTGQANTIYILNSWNYTLTQNIVLSGCSALIGRGQVIVKWSTQQIKITSKQKVIVDNLNLSGVAVNINASNNISLHNLRVHHTPWDAISITGSYVVMIAESQTYNNGSNGIYLGWSTGVVVNNTMSYNNNLWWIGSQYGWENAINNSQFFNNTRWIRGLYILSWLAIYNSSIYNNQTWLFIGYVVWHLHNTMIYNNVTWINNIFPVSLNSSWIIPFDTQTMDYDRVTNPLSSGNEAFFTGSIFDRTTQRWVLTGYNFPDELRYLFGLNILQQEQPVMYISGTLHTYGSNGSDYHADKYIAETEPAWPTAQMSLVNQYFGSWSMYTQNRSGNGWCSLGAFQVVTLDPGTAYSSYLLQSHTIYILSPGEYRFITAGNGFTFGGNCIALIGSWDVRIDKYNNNTTNLIYATDKRSLIIENVHLDGKYIANSNNSQWRTNVGISFDGATYNTTINQVQSFNHKQYGLSFGALSHHNTIINTQVYNNREAGIYFYLVSHHNVINNSMAYNNSGNGIRFANGSHRNAMNNFQSFNNAVGIYGDLTTRENLINNAMIYNNSQYWVFLDQSSGNIFNNIQIYNNTTGFKVTANSNNNVYNGDFKLFDNIADFEGTDADDEYLSVGNTSGFSVWTPTFWTNLMDCSYATNPTFSGTETTLLNTLSGCMLTGQNISIFNGWNTSIDYLFGANIYKQTLPYRYNASDAMEPIPTQYDSGKYIAEIFAIRDTNLDSVVFNFPPIIEPATEYISDVYTATAINTTVHITFVNDPNSPTGYLKINGTDVWLSGYIHNGDTIQIAMTSAPTLSEIFTWTLTNDNNSDIYDIILQTKWPDIIPSTESLAFSNILWAPLSTYTGSTTTVSDIDIGVLATINTGRIAIYSGGSLISSGSTGIVYSGNQLQAMILSSWWYSSVTTWTVSVGGSSASFSVRTLPDSSSPLLSFTDPVATGAVYIDTIAVVSSWSDPVYYKFISNPNDCTSSGTSLYSWAITLTTQTYNGKYFCAYTTLSGIAMPLVSQNTINIDRTAPTTPILLYPADAAEVFFVVFEQTGSYDSGGISWYEYIIAQDYNFIDIINTWFVQTTWTSFSPYNFTETTWDFYWKIRTTDIVWLNSPRSNQWYFTVIDNEDFIFDEREYAALDTDYMSNEITIEWLRTHWLALATVDEWTLYKNDVDKWQSTYVQNGDIITIELTSPDDYDESISSTLTVANRSTDFIVSTAPDGDSCTLSTQDKWKIQIIYDSLVAQYSGDQNRYAQFLYTMRSMLQDEIDLTNDCNLQYLSDLLDGTVQTNLTWINTTWHIAPNCKAYHISYDTGKLAYTSPDFRVPTYFANRDALTRYIDSKNPGDCHISTTTNATWYFGNTDPTKHVTPNGKLYTIQHNTTWYTSAQLSVKKYFSTLVALRKYLDSKNPPFPIWTHVVDRTFTPVNYIAPNAKEYKIYKTNRWYMSYKLMNIKYYTTLDSIKAFISKNNPKK